MNSVKIINYFKIRSKPLNIAISGLSNSGKTTIFNALTGLSVETTIYASVTEAPHRGSVKVPDERVDWLAGVFKPKKTTHSTIEYTDFIGLTRGDADNNRKVLDTLKDADAIVDVLRAFDDPAVMHPDNSVDPLRDARTLEVEWVLSDLELVEKRLTRMADSARRGKKPDETEKKLLVKCKEHLENEHPLRTLSLAPDEWKSLRHLQFVSAKPRLIVLNIAEDDIGKSKVGELVVAIAEALQCKPQHIIPLCGKIEMEIGQLQPDEARDFLSDLGITEPACNRLISVCYEALELISFLTVGEDEVKSWTINRGSSAVAAAGKIHSDIERGFIRAEVVSYDAFKAAGSMAEARKHGSVTLQGKTYLVQDGDIVNFRFNV
ncbi:GTP-dependent nucleic acid-binding protein EngD [Candidatus Magnetobacterium bavaricum]|uniref:GTP-dependent nucleic acid-binding protein EngD n=1 Tax=Candidatus Magnetobacterium bavaricum TaxID=29290 RepID=A0A0F3GJV1_9BACT|nr:GTP-dependent nucleic acid-binding protein EngD [Candidatus Magnetobacterium bavaricum]